MEAKPLIYIYRTIKRPSTTRKAGEHEVRIRISQFKERDFIPLGYSSSQENWDKECNLPKPSHPFYKSLVKKIIKYLDDIAFEIKLAERAGRYISCFELKRKILYRDNNSVCRNKQLKILEFFDKVIADLEEAGNSGYADSFIATRSTVSKLINRGEFITAKERHREKDKYFSEFTEEDHQNYEKLISKDTSESTKSHYLRIYYRIWNLASKDGYFSKESLHPSKFIKFQAYKRIKTKKRSIPEDYLKKILKLSFEPASRLYRTLLLLCFIYYGRGINFGDMCKLKNENITNGTIHYTRSKNHRVYDYTLHSKAWEVITYFKNNYAHSDAGYVFPFLFSIHDTPRKIQQRIQSALKDFNEDLRKMADMVGWHRKFTSNSLRHSFATHLRNNDVNMSIIKEALGHETETQTAVYLDELDDKQIAEAIDRALLLS